MNPRSIRAPDGRKITYAVAGSGPAIVLTNGLTTTTHFWRYLAQRWQRDYTVVTWDLPGHGDSEPPTGPDGAQIAAMPAIITRLMDELALDSAIQIGWSVGSQIVFELARQAPRRCAAVVSLLGPASHVLSNSRLPIGGKTLASLIAMTPQPVLAKLFRSAAQNAGIASTLGRLFGLIGAGTSDADLRTLIESLCRVDVATFQAMAASAEAHSATDVLPSLTMPILIVAGEKDAFAPAQRVARAMHAAAPRSVLVNLPDGTHSALLDHVEEIDRAVRRFLDEHGLGVR